jgi:hypothetical protein
MEARNLKYRDADEHARSAAIRAYIYSDNCRATWGTDKRAEAETFLNCAQLAYSGVRDEPTYRKTFIVVKIEGQVRDRAALRVLDDIAQERGYDKVRSAQAISYRIPRPSK